MECKRERQKRQRVNLRDCEKEIPVTQPSVRWDVVTIESGDTAAINTR